jgi:hypothetical protein
MTIITQRTKKEIKFHVVHITSTIKNNIL